MRPKSLRSFLQPTFGKIFGEEGLNENPREYPKQGTLPSHLRCESKHEENIVLIFTGWWFQPIWKTLVKLEISPNRGEN